MKAKDNDNKSTKSLCNIIMRIIVHNVLPVHEKFVVITTDDLDIQYLTEL